MEFVLFAIVLFFIFAVLEALFEFFGNIVGGAFEALIPFFVFIRDNVYAICGVLVLLFAYFCWEYLRVHPLDEIFDKYKDGLIRKEEAFELILEEVYTSEENSRPNALQSFLETRKINAARRKIKAQTDFIKAFDKYVEARESRR